MRIHILSDLHNEFRPHSGQPVDADVVVLAGDIDVLDRGVAWARDSFDCPVLYVPGNHEYYKGHLVRTLEKMRAAQGERVRVLDRDEVQIGPVRFLGATMWTDFCSTGNSPLATMDASLRMNDFRQIRIGNYRRINPADLVNQSVKAKNWLRAKLAEPHDGPTVVITHHAPSLQSLHGNPHAGTHLDAAYANSYEELMGESVAVWIHGHVHTAVDYNVAGTRVICNPRGYPGERTGFDPLLVIEL